MRIVWWLLLASLTGSAVNGDTDAVSREFSLSLGGITSWSNWHASDQFETYMKGVQTGPRRTMIEVSSRMSPSAGAFVDMSYRWFFVSASTTTGWYRFNDHDQAETRTMEILAGVCQTTSGATGRVGLGYARFSADLVEVDPVHFVDHTVEKAIVGCDLGLGRHSTIGGNFHFAVSLYTLFSVFREYSVVTGGSITTASAALRFRPRNSRVSIDIGYEIQGTQYPKSVLLAHGDSGTVEMVESMRNGPVLRLVYSVFD